MQVETVILIFFGIWLISLTYLFISTSKFLKRLSQDTKGEDFKSAFEKILATQKKNSETLITQEFEIKRLENEGLYHIQKVGLVRFNPFGDLGGDHSFSLAILDGKDSGVVVTVLHSRERTRTYAKAVRGGKAEHELSNEEKKALRLAQRS